MKKIIFAIVLLLSVFGWSQDRPIRADVVFLDTLTTTERNALTMRPSQFALIANSTVDSVQAWIVDKWVNLGSTGIGGETYTFSTGLTNTSGTITVTNPFEESDETKLDGIAAGATVGADWNTNLSNIPANLDLDATNDVTLGTTQIVSGTKTFTGSTITGLDGTTNVSNNALFFVPFTGANYNFTGVNSGIISRNRNFMWQTGISDRTFIFNSDNITAERTYTLPNSSGTIALTDQLATAGTDDQTASEVPITDSGNNFTATDVEGALAELAASGSGGTPTTDASELTTGTLADARLSTNVPLKNGNNTYPGVNNFNNLVTIHGTGQLNLSPLTGADWILDNTALYKGTNPSDFVDDEDLFLQRIVNSGDTPQFAFDADGDATIAAHVLNKGTADGLYAAIGAGGSAAYRKPDNLYEVRASGAMDNTFAVSTGNEDKSLEIITNGTDRYYNPGASFTTLKNAKIKSSQVGDFAVVVPSSGYNMTGNGEAYFATNTTTNTAPQGVYTDSLNPPVVIRNSPTSGLFWAEGFYKLYSIGQVTGMAASSVTENSVSITHNIPAVSVGTIVNCQCSVDGGTPIDYVCSEGVTIPGLTASTTYNFNSRALDAHGNPGQYSADLSVTTASSVVNVYNGQNAADPNTEGNNVLTIEAGGSITLTSSTEQASNGTYSVKGVSTGGTATYPNLQNITSGDTVEVSIDVYINSGFTGNVSLNLDTGEGWTANQSTSTTTTGSWVTLTLTGVASSNNPKLRIGVGTGTHYTDNYRTVIQ